MEVSCHKLSIWGRWVTLLHFLLTHLPEVGCSSLSRTCSTTGQKNKTLPACHVCPGRTWRAAAAKWQQLEECVWLIPKTKFHHIRAKGIQNEPSFALRFTEPGQILVVLTGQVNKTYMNRNQGPKPLKDMNSARLSRLCSDFKSSQLKSRTSHQEDRRSSTEAQVSRTEVFDIRILTLILPSIHSCYLKWIS